MHSQVHQPKIETFHLDSHLNIDPKGFHRKVDSFELISDRCLYMRRGMDHPKFGYLESYLLPDEGLRLSIYHFRPGVPEEHIRYVDIVDIDRPEPNVWRTRDLYLDILARGNYPNAHTIAVDDADELADAIASGVLSKEDGTVAMDTAFKAIADIAGHRGVIEDWLESLGYTISWAREVTLAPAMTK